MAMIESIARINEHSSIRLGGTTGTPQALLLPTLYFDPFNIPVAVNDADIIFVTHDHYDHFSPEDIARVAGNGTHIVVPQSLEEQAYALGFQKPCIHVMNPGDETTVRSIPVRAIHAYNMGKNFHPYANNWLGYQVEYSGKLIYVAGDTDATPEMKAAMAASDIVFVPVGATYTTTAAEAAEAVNEVIASGGRLQESVPTHYGTVVGKPEDGPAFAEAVCPAVEVTLLVGKVAAQ